MITKLLHWGRWRSGGKKEIHRLQFSPFTLKCRRSLFELEAASGAAAAAAAALRTRSDTSWKLHRVPLCLLSPSLARRRPLLAPRCSPSRHTLGVETHGSARRQRWSPLGFRTEWGLEGGGGLEVARQILPPPSRTDAWSGQRAASLRCGAPISAHVLKIPVIRLTPWRQGGSSSNCGAGRGDVYPRGICAGCCCHGNAVIFFLRLLLLSGFENVVGEKNYFNPPSLPIFSPAKSNFSAVICHVEHMTLTG